MWSSGVQCGCTAVWAAAAGQQLGHWCLVSGLFPSDIPNFSLVTYAMYYELMAISRILDPQQMAKEAKKIVSTIGKLILNNRGVIRDVTSMGPRVLPKVISKDQERHFQGYHFLMGFDVSSSVQQELLRTLRRDPRVLRANIIRHDLANKLSPGTSYQRAYNSIPKQV